MEISIDIAPLTLEERGAILTLVQHQLRNGAFDYETAHRLIGDVDVDYILSLFEKKGLYFFEKNANNYIKKKKRISKVNRQNVKSRYKKKPTDGELPFGDIKESDEDNVIEDKDSAANLFGTGGRSTFARNAIKWLEKEHGYISGVDCYKNVTYIGFQIRKALGDKTANPMEAFKMLINNLDSWTKENCFQMSYINKNFARIYFKAKSEFKKKSQSDRGNSIRDEIMNNL
jgi:hypothetical protein